MASNAIQEKLRKHREEAESSLISFIRLVAPHRVLGAIHDELIYWLTRSEAKSHQLVLLPRAHQKSAIAAYYVAWRITRNPAITILYLSSTSALAEKQLKSIKDILTSKIYNRYWPDMIAGKEGKEKWTNGEIAVDHPKRKEEGVRDSTVFTGGLTTSLTGFHCDLTILDDIVVQENAYTEEGRNKVRTQYSLITSIENPGAEQKVVGTRYDPRDLYGDMIDMHKELYDEDGNIVSKEPVYELFQREVEDIGDGTGEFLWPRQKRKDGVWFGFNPSILAQKRAQYLDRMQFRAQYYNDPNDPENMRIKNEKFQYYDRKHIAQEQGRWFFKDQVLNVVAAMDFAFSLRKAADYTAIVVIGVNRDNNIFILDIDRFKTDRISDYFEHLMKLHSKWGFRKVRCETSIAQKAIVRELKDSYIKQHGLLLSIDEHSPTRHQGTKEERIAAILEPRYDNLSIFHYKGGHIQTLEEELMMTNPPHDDIKDALAAAIDVAVVPRRQFTKMKKEKNVIYHARFGGVSI